MAAYQVRSGYYGASYNSGLWFSQTRRVFLSGLFRPGIPPNCERRMRLIYYYFLVCFYLVLGTPYCFLSSFTVCGSSPAVTKFRSFSSSSLPAFPAPTWRVQCRMGCAEKTLKDKQLALLLVRTINHRTNWWKYGDDVCVWHLLATYFMTSSTWPHIS